ncbi:MULTISPECIES: MmgE/PrpD family protein [Methylobacterium]|uniref:MmgE/PrpD family protein n=1 Tax=Methylobacterium longum TaxID=767694 RepID=A0ABT8AUE9_9HYPH|nr:MULTISPECIES: MmgE/PrpD family protein [Methylobacterium]MCJ2100210.1 MmgE/PrpD family protein [Methylobacterium sp. E-046]MDN3573483.1 MmgE/PrpD family protein [Methylobacterium longum]GJE14648.1 2-methylcitrate dehydratase [Methylobacterium longum]
MTAPTRRGLIQGGGALALARALPATAAEADVTGRLARYMAAARDQALPPEVLAACKHRILDTLAAMVSGARMRPGEMALTYVRGLGGTEQAGVIASGVRTTTVNAALANAMCAHADETDDFEPVTKAHPGCATVPAALALAELHGSSGAEFVRAVALGYDLCCRLLLALGPDLVRGTHRSAEGTSSTFGALGGAASLARLDERGMRFALSYAAQQVSGLWSWVRDKDHVEKAFDFAGMGARNGVTAVGMVEAGLTGVADVLDGRHNLLNALSTAPRPELMLEGLGSRFFVTETAIKTFSVGYPIQSPLDATLALRRQYGLTPETVRHILVKLPTDAVGIVGSSAMPDVSCQHLVALALVKGAVSFADSHDAGLMHDPLIAAQQAKVELVGDPALMDPAAPRGAVVAMTLADGRVVEHHTRHPPGTKENPLSTEAVNAKARDLMAPVLGPDATERLIARVNTLEDVADMRALRPLLTA